MSGESLEIIANSMEFLGLNYAYMQYDVANGEELPETYFVGGYQEIERLDEDGQDESSFILTGFNRNASYLALEEAKNKIKEYFPSVCGKTVTTASGRAVAVFYSNTLGNLPTGSAKLKKIEIILTVEHSRKPNRE